MRRVYFVLSLGIIALGVIHITFTPRFFTRLTTAAVWFASGGIAIIMTGILNLLRRAYGETAPGLRAVCLVNNIVMTGFALLAGYTSRASALQFAFVIGVLGGATVFSFFPGAQNGAKTN